MSPTRKKSRKKSRQNQLSKNSRKKQLTGGMSSKKKEPTLDDCFNYLYHPNMDDQPPRSCYFKLDFPTDRPNLNIKPGPSYEYLTQLDKIGLAKPLKINELDLQINVPPKFKSHIKDLSQRYVIIPVHFNNGTTYGIFLDKFLKEWQVFLPPGNRPIKRHAELEVKFRKLVRDRLKLPINSFYHSINYQPPENTYHYDFWPSWIIHQRIKNSDKRESLVNQALEKLIRQSPDYQEFTQQYTDYLIQTGQLKTN